MNKNITVTTILAAGLLFSFFDVAFAVAPWSLFGSALPTKQGESPNHWALELTYAGMNSYAGVKFQDPSKTLTFDKIWNLSTDYRIEDGDHCIQRSPRFLIELDTDGDGLAEKGVIAYFASSLYSAVCQNGWVNSGNVMDIGSQDRRFDTSEFKKGSTDHTYFDALYLAGDYPVVDILLIVDGEGDGHPQTILVDNMTVNNFKLDAQGFSKKPADVEPSDWAYDYIEKLYSAGITNGCDNFNYCPNDCVTRAEMALFLLKANHGSDYAPPPASGIFMDVSVQYWADPWIEQLFREGITVGCNGSAMKFCPEDFLTRAQMAAFLARTFDL